MKQIELTGNQLEILRAAMMLFYENCVKDGLITEHGHVASKDIFKILGIEDCVIREIMEKYESI